MVGYRQNFDFFCYTMCLAAVVWPYAARGDEALPPATESETAKPIQAADMPGAALKLLSVPIPIHSYRLLLMSMDDEGIIWAGSIHQVIHRYDPCRRQV